MLKIKKIRDEKHRRFIASLPCCASGLEGQTQCAHIRHNTGGGMSLKPCDSMCVPLCVEKHSTQHRIGERKFWGDAIEDAKQLAKDLYKVTGNEIKARKLIDSFRWNHAIGKMWSTQ